jgi:hypothetical protein
MGIFGKFKKIGGQIRDTLGDVVKDSVKFIADPLDIWIDPAGDLLDDISGKTSADEMKRQAKILEEQAEEAKNAAERVRQDLNKAKEESIADFELVEAEAKGIITKAQLDQLEELNKTQGGVEQGLRDLDTKIMNLIDKSEPDQIQTLVDAGKISLEALEQGKTNASGQLAQTKEEILNNLEAKGAISRQDRLDARDLAINRIESEQSKILEDIITSGFVSKEELDKGFLDSMGSLLNFRDAAIEPLQPYTDTGKRALAQQRIYQGLATEQEINNFTSAYGDPNDVQKSPLYEFRLAELEKYAVRSQKARGNFLSGRGMMELQEQGVQRISAEEADRRYRETSGLAKQGFAAAGQVSGIQERTGQTAVGLSTDLARQKAGITQSGLSARTQTRQQMGLAGAGVQERTGAGLATDASGLARSEAAVQQQFGISVADLEAQHGTQKASLFVNEALNRNLIASQANRARMQQLSQTGTNIANIGVGFGQARQGIIGTGASQLANLGTSMAQARANTRLGAASQMGGITQAGQQMALGALTKAGEYHTAAAGQQGAFYRGLLNTGAQLYGSYMSGGLA